MSTNERSGDDGKPPQEPAIPIDTQLAALLDTLPLDAAVAVNPHGLIVYASAGITDLLGYQPEEVLGQRVEMLVPEALREAHTHTRAGYQRHPVARRMGAGLNLRARRRDGADVPVDISLTPLPHNSHGIVLAMIRDVTDYVRARDEAKSEAAQRLLQTELARAVSVPGAADETYRQFAEQFAKIVPYDRLVIGALVEGGQMVRFLHVSGVPIAGWEGDKAYEARHLYISNVLDSKKPRFGKAVDRDLQARYPARNAVVAAGLRSVLVAPLVVRGTPIGFLFLASMNENAYAEAEAALAEDSCRFLSVAIENHRLMELNGYRARRAEALAEIGRIISGAAHVEAAFPECAEKVRALVPMDRMTVAIADRTQGTYIDIYWTGVNVESWEPGVPRPLAGTNTALILEGGEPLIFNATSSEELGRLYPQFASSAGSGLASAVSVPLRHGGLVIGALHLRSRLPNAYGAEDVSMAQAVADQIAGAVRDDLLIVKVQRDAEERGVMAEIGRIVSSTIEIGDIYPRFAEQVAKLVPFDRIVIALFGEDLKDVSLDAYIAGTQVPGYTPGGRFPVAGTFFEQMIQSKSSVVIDGDEMRRMAATHPSALPALSVGLQSMLMTPLIWQDRVIGSINFRSKLHNPYTPAVAALADQVSAQIAGAVTTSRLYGESKQDAERRRILAEIGRIIASSLNLDAIYPRFVELAAKLIPFDRIVVSIFDEDQQAAMDAHTAGVQMPAFPQGGTFPVAGTFVEQMIRAKDTVVINGDEMHRMAAENASARMGLSIGLQSMLMTPLIWDNKMVGSLNFRSKLSNPYTPAIVEAAEQVSSQIAGAITTSRLYGQAKQDALARTTIAEFGRMVNTELDLDHVCQVVAEGLGRLMKSDRCVIALSLAGGGRFRIAHVTGVPVDGSELGTTLVPALRARFGLAREDGSVLLGDLPPKLVEQHPELRASGLRSWVEVPVGPAGEPFAYVSLRSRQENAYTEQDLELLKAVALQVAPAFRNATLLEDLEKRVTERTAELSTAVSARTRMLATVSHELRNALAAVTGFNQVLLKNRDGSLTEQQLRILGHVASGNGQINSLVSDLTDFANIDAGQLALEMVRVDLAGLVNEGAASFAPTVEKTRQKIVVSGCDSPVIVQADRDRIAQVLRNLLSNASKYSPAGTEITVSLEASEGAARIAVRDQGVGISEEDQKQLFQSFFRASNPEVRAVSGTGLGLAVSRKLMELHDGGIGVASTPGRGSVFTMWLPLDIMGDAPGIAT